MPTAAFDELVQGWPAPLALFQDDFLASGAETPNNLSAPIPRNSSLVRMPPHTCVLLAWRRAACEAGPEQPVIADVLPAQELEPHAPAFCQSCRADLAQGRSCPGPHKQIWPCLRRSSRGGGCCCCAKAH